MVRRIDQLELPYYFYSRISSKTGRKVVQENSAISLALMDARSVCNLTLSIVLTISLSNMNTALLPAVTFSMGRLVRRKRKNGQTKERRKEEKREWGYKVYQVIAIQAKDFIWRNISDTYGSLKIILNALFGLQIVDIVHDMYLEQFK